MGVLKALQNLNWEWIFYVCLVWLIIYLFMVQGFRRFKIVYTTLALCTLMILSIPLILLTVVASGYFETPNILSVSIIDLTDFQVGTFINVPKQNFSLLDISNACKLIVLRYFTFLLNYQDMPCIIGLYTYV